MQHESSGSRLPGAALLRFSSPWRAGRLIAIGALSLAVVVPSLAWTPSDLDPRTVRDVWEILSPPATGLEPRVDEMAHRIVELGDAAVPVVIGILLGEVAEPFDDEDYESIHPSALRLQDQVLRDSLSRFPAEQLMEELQQKCTGDVELRARLALIGLLKVNPDPRSVEVLLELSKPIEPIHLQRSYIRGTLERTLAAILIDQPGAWRELRHAMPDVPPAFRPMVVRAIGSTGSSTGLGLVTDLLGEDEDLDLVILAEIGNMSQRSVAGVPFDTLDEVRRLLHSEDEKVQRAAAAASGYLNDHQAVPTLSLLVGSETDAVSLAALWSLRRMSGQNLGAEPELWADWYDAELSWWDREATAAFSGLSSQDPADVVFSLNTLMRHSLFRHEIAEAVGPTVLHESPAVVTSACSALRRLGSTRSVPWLIDAMGNETPAERNAAWEALRYLTGLDLPLDAEEWAVVLPE